MSKKLFITGTGTDIGKTYISALIVKKLREAEIKAAYYKAAMSGNTRRADGSLIPGDALFVKKISKTEQSLESMCPYVYENAVSPHLASRLEGNHVSIEVIDKTFKEICESYDYVTVEGSGGILCPICFDEEKIQLEDIVKRYSLPSIIIADAGLGTINSVVLTYEYMKQKNMSVKAIVFNNWHPGNIMEEDNRFMCEYMTGLPVIACVKKDDREIDIDTEKLLSFYE